MVVVVVVALVVVVARKWVSAPPGSYFCTDPDVWRPVSVP